MRDPASAKPAERHRRVAGRPAVAEGRAGIGIEDEWNDPADCL